MGSLVFFLQLLSYIRSAIRLCVYDENYSLSEILNKLNRVIHDDELLSDIFSTLSIVLLDDELGTVKYSGAGDLPVLKFEEKGPELRYFKSDGILLGFSEFEHYSEMDIKLDLNEELYMISDGMIDFEINGEKKSDINLFKEKLYNFKQNKETTQTIKDRLFDKHVSQIDDCSIIIIKKV